MSEQKRYTAQELRKAAGFSDALKANNPSEYNRIVGNMLRQAADTEEENIKLKEQNKWYERQPELMGETAREALSLLKAQEAEIAELRDCLKDACNTELSCNECKSPCSEYTQDDCPIKKRWRKALKGMEDGK